MCKQVAYGLAVLVGYVAAYQGQGYKWLQQSLHNATSKQEGAAPSTAETLVDYQALRLCGSYSLQVRSYLRDTLEAQVAQATQGMTIQQ